MAEVFCREKDDIKSYISDCAKNYMIEKDLQRKSRIILHKESEFQSVKRIISRFKDISQMEFDTIFKIYKLQNYKIDLKYFKNSTYKYATLHSLKTCIKSSTMDDSVEPKIVAHKIINDFIKEIKAFSKPFCKSLTKGKKIKNLIKCGSLSREELDFINSEIVPRRAKKNKNKNMEVKTMSTAYALSNLEKADNYRIILNNVDKKASEVAKLVSNMSSRSVENYLWYARSILLGKAVSGYCPKLLLDVINEDIDKYKSILSNKSNDVIQSKKSLVKQNNKCKEKNKQSYEIFEIIVNNYRRGNSVLKQLLPDMKVKSLTTYVSYLRAFDKGRKDHKHCPTTLYNIWKEKYGSSVDINKQEIKDISSNINTNKQTDLEYIAIWKNNNNKILKVSDNLQYLQGYIEAFKETNSSNSTKLEIKIYQSVS